MFHTVRKFIFDFRVALGKDDDNEQATLDSKQEISRTALTRLSAQLLITSLAIIICASAVVQEHPSESTIRLAHIGFGAVIGYWFR
jgi:hypothetical protein